MKLKNQVTTDCFGLLLVLYSFEEQNSVFKSFGDKYQDKYKEIDSLIKAYAINNFVQNSTAIKSNELFVIIKLLKLFNIKGEKNNYSELLRDKYTSSQDNNYKFKLLTLIFMTAILYENLETAQVDFLQDVLFLNVFSPLLVGKEETLLSFQAIFLDYNDFYKAFIKVLKNIKAFIAHNNNEQKTFLFWFTQFIASIYDLGSYRNEIGEACLALFLEALKKDDFELVADLYDILTDLMLSVKTDQAQFKEFNDCVSIPFSNYVKNTVVKTHKLTANDKLKPSGKTKIAFVTDYLVCNSPFKALYSLLSGINLMNPDNYEIYVIENEALINSARQEQTNKNCILSLLGIKAKHLSIKSITANNYVSLSKLEKYKKVREKIVELEIDVLIVENSSPIFDFLLASRTAPIQIYLSYGNYVYDVNGIDYRILSCALSPGVKLIENCGYLFSQFKWNFLEEFMNPALNAEQKLEIINIRNLYPKDTFILGSIGRLMKLYNKEFLTIVLNILNKYPNTIFLACGSGDKEIILEEIATVNKNIEVKNIEARFIFTGSINTHVYSHIIDLFLNTFPFPQGLALIEYAIKKKPIVALALKDWPEVTKFVPPKYLANTIEEYEQIIGKAINDKVYYEQMSEDCLGVAKRGGVKESASLFLSLVEILKDKPTSQQLQKRIKIFNEDTK